MLCDFGLSLGINYCLFGLFIDDIEQQFPSKSLQSADKALLHYLFFTLDLHILSLNLFCCFHVDTKLELDTILLKLDHY
jgi:hypothetical protein